MKPPKAWGRTPWFVVIGLFVLAVGYVVVAKPGATASQSRPAATPLPTSTAHPDGLSDRHDGYTLAPVTLPTNRGQSIPVAFRILGPDGKPATEYATVQSKQLHMYLVREDLTSYQHLHPQFDGDTWTASVDIPDGGFYRVYAEFTPMALANRPHPTVLGVPFVITGDTTYVPLPAPEPSATVGPYTVKRMDGTARLTAGVPTDLRLQVFDATGAPVQALEPYLDAYGHASAFDMFDQSLTHLHSTVTARQPAPVDGVLTFPALFAHPGEQRLFLQFQVAGVLHQAAFTVAVNEATPAPSGSVPSATK